MKKGKKKKKESKLRRILKVPDWGGEGQRMSGMMVRVWTWGIQMVAELFSELRKELDRAGTVTMLPGLDTVRQGLLQEVQCQLCKHGFVSEIGTQVRSGS